jgi:hypothetical protein
MAARLQSWNLSNRDQDDRKCDNPVEAMKKRASEWAPAGIGGEG